MPSSRQYPYIRFDYDDREKLHRQAVEIKNLTHGYDRELFKNFNLLVEAGERIAVIGENGIGKTTFLRALVGELKPNHGEIKWAEKAKIGYFAQDHATDFEKDVTLFDWQISHCNFAVQQATWQCGNYFFNATKAGSFQNGNRQLQT